MAEYGNDGCCRCCFGFIITSGLTALFMWLSLRTTKPVCSIQDFYVPALNKSANDSTNHTISFDLKLDNENKDKGIYYDAFNLTFFYAQNATPLHIANYSVPAFYQGHKKNTHRKNVVDTDGVPWEEAFTAALNGSVYFRVDMKTAVRFKILGWKTKRHELMVGAKVEVNNSTGGKVFRKGIRLKSTAPKLDCYRARVGPLALVVSIASVLLFI